jgi:hypothetical protein
VISFSSSHLVPLSGPLTCLNLCGLALFSPSHTTGSGASKRAPLLVEIGRDLQEVLATSEADAGDLLRKLLDLPRRVASLSQRVACGVLHVPRTDAFVSDGGDQGRVGKPMASGRRKTEKDDARS